MYFHSKQCTEGPARNTCQTELLCTSGNTGDLTVFLYIYIYIYIYAHVLRLCADRYCSGDIDNLNFLPNV